MTEPAGRETERGSIVLIVAVAMVGVFAVAGLVLDVGQYREMVRANQVLADTASLAAGPKLASSGGSDPVGACGDAFQYLKMNAPGLPAGLSLPCSNLPATCDPSNPPGEATVAAVGGGYTIDISYPVPDSDIANSAFASGAGSADGNLCQRMKVTVARTGLPAFSGVVGARPRSLSASAVVRGWSGSNASQVAALLLLARNGCGALQTSGGGSTGQGIVVEPADAGNPGRIQADSAGIVGSGECNTTQTAAGEVIYGTALPGGGPSIQALADTNGDPGTIKLYSLNVGGRGGYQAGAGISPAPSPGGIASRISIDRRYGSGIANLHAAAYAQAVLTSAPAGYTTIQGAGCTPSSGTISGDLFINCGDFAPSGVVVLTGQHFIVKGTLTVANGQTLSLPNAASVAIRGCTSGCNGSNNYAVSVSGNLYVNTGTTDGTTVPCTTRQGVGAGGIVTNTTTIATFGGPFNVTSTGNVSLCQTTVYLGANSASYSPEEVTSPTTAPTFCSTSLPCPANGTGPQAINIAGNADWSAPNQYSSGPPAGSLDDLALWEESDQPAAIKGQGTSRTEGVYFLPNASVTFTGQASQTQPLNAQFIARYLNVSGQGTLYLQPQPQDAVRTVPFTDIVLIR